MATVAQSESVCIVNHEDDYAKYPEDNCPVKEINDNNLLHVEAWQSIHFGQRNANGNGKREKRITFLLQAIVVVVLFCLIVLHLKYESDWKNNFSQQLENLEAQRFPVTYRKAYVKHSMDDSLNKDQEKFAMINLVGDTDKEETKEQGQKYTKWIPTVRHGSIQFNNSSICIQLPGVYNVYGQMHFIGYINYNRYGSTEMGFQIMRNDESLVSALVQVVNCNSSCTRYLSRLVTLKKNDKLRIYPLKGVVMVKMSPDKTQFGALLVKAA